MKKIYEDFAFGVLFVLIVTLLLSLTVVSIHKIDNIRAETVMFKSTTQLNEIMIKKATNK